MYAHKAIDDLNWYCEKLKSRRDLTNHINIIQKEIIPWIISSQKFNMSDVDEVMEHFTKKYDKKEPFRNDLGGVRLPYHKIWLEYDFKNEDISDCQSNTKHRAILAREISNDVIQCIILAEIKLGGSLSKWSFSPTSYHISIDKPLMETKYYQENGLTGKINWLTNIGWSSMGSNLSDDDARTCLAEDTIDLCVLNMALMLLGCKNIEREEHKPSRALALSRNKKNKAPLFTYYTLKIKPIGKQQESIPKDLWHNRIHLCRGHFKTYNESNPLFGHITGRFWWQPHVRGQNRDGVVMKDYEITTEPEE